MTEKIESLDLDRLEALARAATPGPWHNQSITDDECQTVGLSVYAEAAKYPLIDEDHMPGIKDAEFIAEANPAAVLALIALARRAQPECEAPQADLRMAIANLPLPKGSKERQHGFVDCKSAVLDLLPAAQHAESGAQAEISNQDIERLADKHNVYANVSSNNYDVEIAFARDVLALAAQSQGAQAAPGQQFVDAALDFAKAHVACDEMEARDDQGDDAVSDDQYEKATAAYNRTKAALVSAYKAEGAALAAKAEAPAPRVIGGQRWSKEAEMTEGWLAAQQAAAPGALALLNSDELAALHRFQETCQDFDSGGYDVDKDMMKRLAAIGVIESKGFNRYQFTEFGDYVVENQAPSALGTPEAPATDALDAARYRWLCQHGHERMPEEIIQAMDAAHYEGEPMPKGLIDQAIDKERAAQLDGGQGEGEKA